MSGPPDISLAEARVKAARARMLFTLGEVQDRLKPSHLAQDAVEGAVRSFASVARKGREAVRGRPLTVAAITGAIGLVMARGWISDIIGGHRNKHETPETPKGLKRQRKPAKTAKGHSK